MLGLPSAGRRALWRRGCDVSQFVPRRPSELLYREVFSGSTRLGRAGFGARIRAAFGATGMQGLGALHPKATWRHASDCRAEGRTGKQTRQPHPLSQPTAVARGTAVSVLGRGVAGFRFLRFRVLEKGSLALSGLSVLRMLAYWGADSTDEWATGAVWSTPFLSAT
eukprot:364282-Chlamydomonas_euryale.AAC.62